MHPTSDQRRVRDHHHRRSRHRRADLRGCDQRNLGYGQQRKTVQGCRLEKVDVPPGRVKQRQRPGIQNRTTHNFRHLKTINNTLVHCRSP